MSIRRIVLGCAFACLVGFTSAAVAQVRPAGDAKWSTASEKSQAGRSSVRHHKSKRHRRGWVRMARHHKVRYASRVRSHGAGVVRSKSGATARVNPAYTSNFQCVVNGLDASGYPVKFMGGYGARAFRHSKHPSGRALDINQYARDVTRPAIPRARANQIAQGCGLLHGAVWRNADAGHFEVPSSYARRSTATRYARRHYRHRYAGA